MATKKKKPGGNTIALNKRARHDYFIEEKFEAGIVLEGWEVKSMRESHAQLTESYVFIKNGEAFISGMHITPLYTASTHVNPENTRVRKLLLHRKQLDKLIGAVERKGYTLVGTALYWSHGLVKVEIGLAKGKQQHDKRATEKDRDWQREKGRIMRGR
jgi:SsrA-binding protein